MNLGEEEMFGKKLIFGLGLIIIAALAAAPACAQSCGAPGSNSNVNFNLHQPISQTVTNSCASPAATVTLGGEFFFEFHCGRPTAKYRIAESPARLAARNALASTTIGFLISFTSADQSNNLNSGHSVQTTVASTSVIALAAFECSLIARLAGRFFITGSKA